MTMAPIDEVSSVSACSETPSLNRFGMSGHMQISISDETSVPWRNGMERT